ncbi:MAG: hypothetical protein ACI9U2_002582 [Bradymonadia bacterium]|jgi:hypothetical protein
MRVPCHDCGAQIAPQVGQHLTYGGELVWHQSFSCSRCGAALAVDDCGFPPESARQDLLAKHGEWRVVLVDERQRMLAVKALRALFEWDLKRAAAHLKAAQAGLWSGTNVEALWVAHHLNADGVGAEVVRVG